MSPTHEIERDMNHDEWLSKMCRQSYAGWKQREAEARQRAEKLKRNACTTWKH